MSSSNYRGTKRSSDSAPSGRSFKSAKPGGPQRGGPGGGGGGYNKGGSGGGGGYKGGNGGGGGGYKGAKPAWNKGGNGKPSFNKGGKPDFNKGGNFKGKGKAAPREDDDAAPAKRKRPVTQGGGEDDAMSVDDNDDFDGDDFDMEEDGDKEGGEGAGAEGAGAEGGEAVEKRGKMTKEERRALHAEQPHRRTLLPSYVLLTETLLPLWETARQSEMPKEERKAAISELYAAVKGHALEISRGHKGGRVLQTIVKYGGKEERTGVAMELQPQWRAMLESKYSKFLMGKLIRYCPTIRPLLIPAIAPHLSQLIFHAHAIDPISDFYDLWANGAERRMLVRGFYPREVALFDGGKETGDVAGLEGALENTAEAGRVRVLEAVEKTVLDVFNATQKTALAQSIFHRLVNEYLTCTYRFLDAETANKKMHELLDASLESLPEIVHTKDGSAVVRELIIRGTAKDRKQILQQLKKHVEAMCKDADAQLVLFTAFDCVDDTKLMGKAFVTDVIALAPSLLEDGIGRRSVLYVLTPTASRHYMPSTLALLAKGAAQAKELGTSKKDAAVRRKELVTYGSEGLLQLVADKGADLLKDDGAALAIAELMLHTTGDKAAAIASLTAPLAAPFSGDGTHVLELAYAPRVYKTLLSGGHYNMKTKAINVLDPALGPAFAQAFWAAISSDDAGGAANAIRVAAAAPFVAVELLAALGAEGKDARAVLAEGKDEIAASEAKGAKVLLESLA